SSAVQVWFGQLNGTFVYQTEYFVGFDAWKVFVGDVNSDGIVDLMVDSSWNGIQERPLSILLGNGDGSFQAQQLFRFNSGMAKRPRLTDIDGDGHPDLLAVFVQASPLSFDFVVGLNQGTGGVPSAGFHISMEVEPGLPVSLEASTDL